MVQDAVDAPCALLRELVAGSAESLHHCVAGAQCDASYGVDAWCGVDGVATNSDARRDADVSLGCDLESDAAAQSDAPCVGGVLVPGALRNTGAVVPYDSWLGCDAPKCVGVVAGGYCSMNVDVVAARCGPPHGEPQ